MIVRTITTILIFNFVSMGSSALAQNLALTFDELSQNKNTYIANDQNLAVIAPFAQEWDRLAIVALGKVSGKNTPDYSYLNSFKNKDVLAHINEASKNKAFVEFLDSKKAEESFMSIYSMAHEQGSSISAFAPEEAFQLWATSKFSLQPDLSEINLQNIGKNIDVQRCLWIIWCQTPPEAPSK